MHWGKLDATFSSQPTHLHASKRIGLDCERWKAAAPYPIGMRCIASCHGDSYCFGQTNALYPDLYGLAWTLEAYLGITGTGQRQPAHAHG